MDWLGELWAGWFFGFCIVYGSLLAPAPELQVYCTYATDTLLEIAIQYPRGAVKSLRQETGHTRGL